MAATLRLIATVFLISCPVCFAGHGHPERWYTARWCAKHGGQAEYRLPDLTRVDCLTDTHAIECDFARRWHEAIGQSLFYAAETGRRAGIVLIVEAGESRFLERLKRTISHHNLQIDVWVAD